MKQQVSLRRGVLLALPVILAPLAFGHGLPDVDDQVGEGVEVPKPGAASVDDFHPDKDVPVTPLYGGRVIVHLSSMPESINYAIENSAVTRRMLYEVHESLLIQDWEEHDYRNRLAEQHWVEDLVILKPDRCSRADQPIGLFGNSPLDLTALFVAQDPCPAPVTPVPVAALRTPVP